LLAINHWPIAVETHSANHPTVRHLCESVERIDPRVVVPGGRLHLLLAGPECTHFSTARGGRPVNPQSRASAWHILKWAQELYIDTILIENVPEFRTWGPDRGGHEAAQEQEGRDLSGVPDRAALARLHASRTGSSTPRTTATRRRGSACSSWRAAASTRALADADAQQGRAADALRRAQAVAAGARGDRLDGLTGRASFTGRSRSSRRRSRASSPGLRKFGGPELQPFLVLMEHSGRLGSRRSRRCRPSRREGRRDRVAQPFLVRFKGTGPRAATARAASTSRRLPTLTASGESIPRSQAYVLGQQSGSVPRSTDDQLPTLATDGAVSLVRPFLVPMYGERPTQSPRTHGVDEPVPTIPATGGGKFGVVEPFILDAAHGSDDNCRAKPIDQPLGVVTGSNRFALAEPFLTKYNRTATGAYSVDEPVDTISTRDRFGLVQPVVDGYVLDIHFRMLQPHELAAAMSFPKSYVFAGNREDTVKQIGNSWPGELARALCLEVVSDYATGHKADAWRKARIA
jgi:DNA (cytosine-5)-methyltransferase 1